MARKKIALGPLHIAEMCGSRWYRLSDWRMYPLFWSLKNKIPDRWGFGIGPILFWDGK